MIFLPLTFTSSLQLPLGYVLSKFEFTLIWLCVSRMWKKNSFFIPGVISITFDCRQYLRVFVKKKRRYPYSIRWHDTWGVITSKSSRRRNKVRGICRGCSFEQEKLYNFYTFVWSYGITILTYLVWGSFNIQVFHHFFNWMSFWSKERYKFIKCNYFCRIASVVDVLPSSSSSIKWTRARNSYKNDIKNWNDSCFLRPKTHSVLKPTLHTNILTKAFLRYSIHQGRSISFQLNRKFLQDDVINESSLSYIKLYKKAVFIR